MPKTAPLEDTASKLGASLVGKTIAGKFAIESILGAGAMGVLYLARQIALDKVVAIKVMHASIAADKTFAARFHLEAKAASRLDHPNSVRILDFGQEPDGLLYIAMDYLGGRDLLDVINNEWPLTTERIVSLISQALSALAVAHDMGVMHRDLKPENLMVLKGKSDDGTPTDLVKVCDFGIAKINDPTEGGSQLTTGHVVMGTPAYMAPEQAHGRPADPRADVYSMGVILYQLLTRSVPFDGPTPLATVVKIAHDDPVPPSTRTPGVDRRLEVICLRAMSKIPEQRYQTAREMRAALQNLSSVNVASVPPELSGLIARSETREMESVRAPSRRAWPLGVAAVLVGFLGAFFVDRFHGSAPVDNVSLVSPTKAPSPEEARIEKTNALSLTVAPSAPAEPASSSQPAGSSSAKPRKTKSSAAAPEASGPALPPAPSPAAQVAAAPPIVESAPPPAPPTQAAHPPGASPATNAPARTAPPMANDTPRPIDPNLVRVEIGGASSTTGTSAVTVNKVMMPLAGRFSGCYRSVLPQTVDANGPVNLHFETNEDGVITEARLGARLPPALASCIIDAVRGRKIPNVDTGNASADVPLSFKLR